MLDMYIILLYIYIYTLVYKGFVLKRDCCDGHPRFSVYRPSDRDCEIKTYGVDTFLFAPGESVFLMDILASSQ